MLKLLNSNLLINTVYSLQERKSNQWAERLKVKLKVCASLINVTTVCGFRRGSDHERCSRSEEDFYYTEINQWERQPSPPLPVPCSPAPPSPASSSPSSPPSPPPPSPPSPASPTCSALSRSAPSSSGSSWQVQSEHSYQVGGARRTEIGRVCVRDRRTCNRSQKSL